MTAACMTRYEAWPISARNRRVGGAVLLRRGAPCWTRRRVVRAAALYSLLAIFLFVAQQPMDHRPLVRRRRFLRGRERGAGPALAGLAAGDGGPAISSPAPPRSGRRRLGAAADRGDVRAIARTCLAGPRAGARGCRGGALVRVLQRTSAACRYSLPLVTRVHGVVATGIALVPRRLRVLRRRRSSSPASAAALAPRPPRRSSPNRSVTPSTGPAGRRSPRTCAIATMAATIMMSMGSLAHYMHDLSHEGFNIHDFLHEGNGDLWVCGAARGPARLRRWVAIEEQREGGDTLYQRARTRSWRLRTRREGEASRCGSERRTASAQETSSRARRRSQSGSKKP